MAASKRRPVWVIIPSKSLKRIGVIKSSPPIQHTAGSDGGERPASSPCEPPQSPVLQPSQRLLAAGGRGKDGATEVTQASRVDVAVDNSSAAHCKVERRRKRKIATSIQTLAEMLQLKEVDPKKIAKADILKLALDHILKLKAANTELESNISNNTAQEFSTENRQLLDDKLEELLLEHVSLKKQLRQVSRHMTAKEVGDSNDCISGRQGETSIEEANSINSAAVVSFTNCASQVDQREETARVECGHSSSNSRCSLGPKLQTESTIDSGSSCTDGQLRQLGGVVSSENPDTSRDSRCEGDGGGGDTVAKPREHSAISCSVAESREDSAVNNPHCQLQSVVPARTDAQLPVLECQSNSEVCGSISDLIESADSEAHSKCSRGKISLNDISTAVVLVGTGSSSEVISATISEGGQLLNIPQSSVEALESSPCNLGDNTLPDSETISNSPFGAEMMNDSHFDVEIMTSSSVPVSEGHLDCADMKGSETSAVMKGSETSAVMKGSETSAVMKGSETSAVMEGPDTSAVMEGSDTSAVMEGPDTSAVMEGSDTSAVMEGPDTSAVMEVLEKSTHQSTNAVDQLPVSPVAPTITLGTLHQPSSSSDGCREGLVIEAKESAVISATSSGIVVEGVAAAKNCLQREATVCDVSKSGDASCNPKQTCTGNSSTAIHYGFSVTCDTSALDCSVSEAAYHSCNTSLNKSTLSESLPSTLPPVTSSISSKLDQPSPLVPSSTFFSASSSSCVSLPSQHVLSSSSLSSKSPVINSSNTTVHPDDPLPQSWPVSSLLSQSQIPRSYNSTKSSISGSSDCNVSNPMSISSDWFFAQASDGLRRHFELTPAPSSSSNSHALTSTRSIIDSTSGSNSVGTATCIATASSRKRKSKSTVSCGGQGREAGSVGVAAPRKTAKTSEGMISHQQDSAAHLNCTPAAPSSRAVPESSGYVLPQPDCRERADESSPTRSQTLDFRHCRTFAASAQLTPPTSIHPTPPAPPTLPVNAQPACSNHMGQDIQSYTHQHHSHSVTVQPRIDHSHSQMRSSHFSQPSQCSAGRTRSSRSTTSSSVEQQMDQYRHWWGNGNGHHRPTDPNTHHSFPPPPPPPPQQFLSHQHLDSHHQAPPPHFLSPDYDLWPHTVREPPSAAGGWNSRSAPPPSSYHPYGANLPNPTAGGRGMTSEEAVGRQWRTCNNQRHHPEGFMSHDHITCANMTESPFPGVWRPYSEPNPLPPPPSHPPPRGSFCDLESTAPSMPPPHHQQLHFPFLDSRVSSSAQQHLAAAQPSCSQHLVKSTRRTTAHPQTHYTQMEPTPSAHQPSCSNEGAPSCLQMVPTQPSSRTESFFVDKLLYDIG